MLCLHSEYINTYFNEHIMYNSIFLSHPAKFIEQVGVRRARENMAIGVRGWVRSHFCHFLLNREDIKYPGLPLKNKKGGGDKWGKKVIRKSFKKEDEWSTVLLLLREM